MNILHVKNSGGGPSHLIGKLIGSMMTFEWICSAIVCHSENKNFPWLIMY